MRCKRSPARTPAASAADPCATSRTTAPPLTSLWSNDDEGVIDEVNLAVASALGSEVVRWPNTSPTLVVSIFTVKSSPPHGPNSHDGKPHTFSKQHRGESTKVRHFCKYSHHSNYIIAARKANTI